MQFLAERLANYAASLKYEQLGEADRPRSPPADDRFLRLCAWGRIGRRRPKSPADWRPASRPIPGAGISAAAITAPAPNSPRSSTACLFRYLDYNDTYLSLEPAHPSDNLAAIIAAAQVAGAGGKEVITAAVIAYEIQCRLCDAASIRAGVGIM